ncbi:MAG: hypothetical protein CMF31_01960 [Kordiimonas sp.]|nr:hypothetical protein [Kordiimonas sp.]
MILRGNLNIAGPVPVNVENTPAAEDKPFALVAMDDNDWFTPWMNRQQILSRLGAMGWPVLYSTGAFTVWERKTANWQQANHYPDVVSADNVLVEKRGRRFCIWPGKGFLHRLAVGFHARFLKRSLQQGHDKPLLFYCYNPQFADYLDALRPVRTVFHIRDYYLKAETKIPVKDRFETLCNRADLIIASGADMARGVPDKDQHKLHIIPNGADAAAFQAALQLPEPDDLKEIPHPRIGYVGNVSKKFDVDLLDQLSAMRPDWHFVIVGELILEGDDLALWQKCVARSNVHFLNFKQTAEVPAYVAHMDVNAMFYRVRGGWWEFGYPLKMHEYLATGHPVVSTELPAIREFERVIDIVHGPEECMSAIERAVAGRGKGSREERQAVAFANTWDQRCQQIDELLQGLAVQPEGAE